MPIGVSCQNHLITKKMASMEKTMEKKIVKKIKKEDMVSEVMEITEVNQNEVESEVLSQQYEKR